MLVRHPQRLREAAGPGAEKARVFELASPAHRVETVRGLERPQENGCADTLRLTDDVRAPVNAVRTVDVQPARRTEHGRVASSEAWERVARRIVRGVSLRLDDDAPHSVDQQRPPDERA